MSPKPNVLRSTDAHSWTFFVLNNVQSTRWIFAFDQFLFSLHLRVIICISMWSRPISCTPYQQSKFLEHKLRTFWVHNGIKKKDIKQAKEEREIHKYEVNILSAIDFASIGNETRNFYLHINCVDENNHWQLLSKSANGLQAKKLKLSDRQSK